VVGWRLLFGFLSGHLATAFGGVLASLAEKEPKNFPRALRALFCKQISWENTLLRLLVRRYENQKTFPLVFSFSPVLVGARSAPNFFFPWNFLLKRSQDEVRSV